MQPGYNTSTYIHILQRPIKHSRVPPSNIRDRQTRLYLYKIRCDFFCSPLSRPGSKATPMSNYCIYSKQFYEIAEQHTSSSSRRGGEGGGGGGLMIAHKEGHDQGKKLVFFS